MELDCYYSKTQRLDSLCLILYLNKVFCGLFVCVLFVVILGGEARIMYSFYSVIGTQAILSYYMNTCEVPHLKMKSRWHFKIANVAIMFLSTSEQTHFTLVTCNSE